MNRTALAVAVVALVALAGCAGLSGSDQPDVESGIEVGDDGQCATNVTQTIGIEAGETTAGEELTGVGATYPRDHFTVRSVEHDAVRILVDTDDDGESEREFNETHVSGVNTNAYSVAVTMDTDYVLESGDVVTIEYPAVDNPDEAGEYAVEVRLNDRQTANATVTIE